MKHPTQTAVAGFIVLWDLFIFKFFYALLAYLGMYSINELLEILEVVIWEVLNLLE